MRSPVGGNILLEVGNMLPAEGGSILLVAGNRHIPGEVVVANRSHHIHHIHPVEEGTVLEEEEHCIAYLTIFQAICLRTHEYLTMTVAAADHIHWTK